VGAAVAAFVGEDGGGGGGGAVVGAFVALDGGGGGGGGGGGAAAVPVAAGVCAYVAVAPCDTANATPPTSMALTARAARPRPGRKRRLPGSNTKVLLVCSAVRFEMILLPAL
jgi:hypothetical protein